MPCAFQIAGPARRGLVGGVGWARPRAPVSLSVGSKMHPSNGVEAQRRPFQERPSLARAGPGLIVRLDEGLPLGLQRHVDQRTCRLPASLDRAWLRHIRYGGDASRIGDQRLTEQWRSGLGLIRTKKLAVPVGAGSEAGRVRIGHATMITAAATGRCTIGLLSRAGCGSHRNRDDQLPIEKCCALIRPGSRTTIIAIPLRHRQPWLAGQAEPLIDAGDAQTRDFGRGRV